MRYLVTIHGEYNRAGYSGSRKAFTPQVEASTPEEAKQKALEIAKRSGYTRCEAGLVKTMDQYRIDSGISNDPFQNKVGWEITDKRDKVVFGPVASEVVARDKLKQLGGDAKGYNLGYSSKYEEDRRAQNSSWKPLNTEKDMVRWLEGSPKRKHLGSNFSDDGGTHEMKVQDEFGDIRIVKVKSKKFKNAFQNLSIKEKVAELGRNKNPSEIKKFVDRVRQGYQGVTLTYKDVAGLFQQYAGMSAIEFEGLMEKVDKMKNTHFENGRAKAEAAIQQRLNNAKDGKWILASK